VTKLINERRGEGGDEKWGGTSWGGSFAKLPRSGPAQGGREQLLNAKGGSAPRDNFESKNRKEDTGGGRALLNV